MSEARCPSLYLTHLEKWFKQRLLTSMVLTWKACSGV